MDTIRYAQNVSKYAFSDRFIYPSKVNTAACTKNSKDISTDPEASDNNAINKQKNPRTRNMRGICASPFPSAQSRYCQLHVSQSIQHYTCKHVWCKRETLTKRWIFSELWTGIAFCHVFSLLVADFYMYFPSIPDKKPSFKKMKSTSLCMEWN